MLTLVKTRENDNKSLKQEHARLKGQITQAEREKQAIDHEIKELEKVLKIYSFSFQNVR